MREAAEIKASGLLKGLCGLISEFCAMSAESTVESKMLTVDSKASCDPVHPDLVDCPAMQGRTTVDSDCIGHW